MTPTNSSFSLAVRIQPRAKTNKIVGFHGTALKIQIAAPAEDGKANAELISFLANVFSLPKKQITILRGAHHREKVIAFEGLTRETGEAFLQTWRQKEKS